LQNSHRKWYNGINTNAFRYCGEYYDAETGTIYLRARCYDPSNGRFTQRDSVTGDINDPLSLNLYTYCHNNPISGVDPSGHFKLPKWAKAAIVATVAVAVVAVVAVTAPVAAPVIVGAVIGATVSGGLDAIDQYKKTGKVDIAQTIVAASGGAVTGALGGGAGGKGIQTVAGAAVGFIQTAADDWVSDKKSSTMDYTVNALAGGLSGLLAGDGAQCLRGAKWPGINRFFEMDNFSLFAPGNINSRAVVKSMVRGVGKDMLTEGGFYVATEFYDNAKNRFNRQRKLGNG